MKALKILYKDLKKTQKPYGYFKHMHHLPHTYAGFTGLCAKKYCRQVTLKTMANTNS